MKTFSIIILGLTAFGCSINPGTDLSNFESTVDIPFHSEDFTQPSSGYVDPLVEAIYNLEVKVSRDVLTPGITESALSDKYRSEYDSILLEILAVDQVHVEVYDSALRMGLIFRHESVDAILANLQKAIEDSVYTASRKRYPIVRCYLSKLYPAFPSKKIAVNFKEEFNGFSYDEDLLSRWLFQFFKNIQVKYPAFNLEFYGPKRLNTFLYGADFNIKAHDINKSFYPEPIRFSMSEEERLFWLKDNLKKFKLLINGRYQS